VAKYGTLVVLKYEIEYRYGKLGMPIQIVS